MHSNPNIIRRNQLGVIFNPYQNVKITKVLTVCSAGCLRSPTAAHILASPPFNLNTRCCGINAEYAIVPMTPALLMWADVIVVMEEWMRQETLDRLTTVKEANGQDFDVPIHCLDIPDNFSYRDEILVRTMTQKFTTIFGS